MARDAPTVAPASPVTGTRHGLGATTRPHDETATTGI
jgi:hypothetical protein